MAKIKLTLEVDLQPNGERVRDIAAALEHNVRDMIGNGGITGGTPAEVDSYDVNVEWEESSCKP